MRSDNLPLAFEQPPTSLQIRPLRAGHLGGHDSRDRQKKNLDRHDREEKNLTDMTREEKILDRHDRQEKTLTLKLDFPGHLFRAAFAIPAMFFLNRQSFPQMWSDYVVKEVIRIIS